MWGERLIEFGDRSCDLVFELIERYRIECEALRPGYVSGGYGAKGRRFNREWARQWSERGREVRFLERDEIADLIGTRRYGTGMHDARGGSVQPLAYARGLARAAIEEGAVVHGASAATAIVGDGAGWSVRTERASVACEFVVLATNGYTGDLWPGLRQSVVPVASFVTATAPLGHNVLPSVLPGRHAVSETARVTVYYRLDRQGRFIIGGRGRWFDVAVHAPTLRMFALPKRCASFRSSKGWTGSITGRAGRPSPATICPGCSPSNAASTPASATTGAASRAPPLMGQQLANVILAETEPLVEVRGPERFAFHRFRQAGISYRMLTGSLLDRLDRRRAA